MEEAKTEVERVALNALYDVSNQCVGGNTLHPHCSISAYFHG